MKKFVPPIVSIGAGILFIVIGYRVDLWISRLARIYRQDSNGPLKQKAKSQSSKAKDYAISVLITIGICLFPLGATILCWSATKFPPQIFGNNEDHFRAHVISPIPDSVEILDVKFDDIIIHPDVTYYFRFHVNRSDLEKIISYRSLSRGEVDCSSESYAYPPEWWIVDTLDNVEGYIYDEGKYGSLLITLCYHVPSRTAYYMFLTY